MILFNSDYCEGAHPDVLNALSQTNLEQSVGYEEDIHCDYARHLIQQACGTQASVWFFSGGTQTNLSFISHVLKPWQAVISTDTGHINVHETGAIESTGHKVLTAPDERGRLTPKAICEILASHTDHHMVEPKMVYISHPTEIGTLYTKTELEAIARFCKEHNLYLYLDGARLAMGLDAGDISLKTIASTCDAFYIGGTKCGALFGEALVITNATLASDFAYTIKQRGALFAKGRVLGVQFEALMQNNLYVKIGHHANSMADKLRSILSDFNLPFNPPTVTNQIFVTLPDTIIQLLRETFDFQNWKKVDGHHTTVRLVTSWATTEMMINAFEDKLKNAINKTYSECI